MQSDQWVYLYETEAASLNTKFNRCHLPVIYYLGMVGRCPWQGVVEQISPVRAVLRILTGSGFKAPSAAHVVGSDGDLFAGALLLATWLLLWDLIRCALFRARLTASSYCCSCSDEGKWFMVCFFSQQILKCFPSRTGCICPCSQHVRAIFSLIVLCVLCSAC